MPSRQECSRDWPAVVRPSSRHHDAATGASGASIKPGEPGKALVREPLDLSVSAVRSRRVKPPPVGV
jgi:hypothetical protein